MREITLEELLSAGCHFGHQVTRHNPKARDFVFEARDNIHIIDLAKTKEGLENAAKFVKSVAETNGTLLIVFTKRQAQPIVLEEVKKAFENLGVEKEGVDVNATESKYAKSGIFLVASHWVGGTLTNFSEVSKNYKKLKDLKSRLKDEYERSKYTKKEIGLWEKEVQKLEMLYGGIADMTKTPTAMFVVDTHLEELAVREADDMGVATIGIVDTNSDPTLINYPIPANDDAVGSIRLITSYILDAWVEGKKSAESKVKTEQPKEEKKESKEEKKEVKEKPKKETKAKKEEVKEEKKKKETTKKTKSKTKTE